MGQEISQELKDIKELLIKEGYEIINESGYRGLLIQKEVKYEVDKTFISKYRIDYFVKEKCFKVNYDQTNDVLGQINSILTQHLEMYKIIKDLVKDQAECKPSYEDHVFGHVVPCVWVYKKINERNYGSFFTTSKDWDSVTMLQEPICVGIKKEDFLTSFLDIVQDTIVDYIEEKKANNQKVSNLEKLKSTLLSKGFKMDQDDNIVKKVRYNKRKFFLFKEEVFYNTNKKKYELMSRYFTLDKVILFLDKLIKQKIDNFNTFEQLVNPTNCKINDYTYDMLCDDKTVKFHYDGTCSVDNVTYKLHELKELFNKE